MSLVYQEDQTTSSWCDVFRESSFFQKKVGVSGKQVATDLFSEIISRQVVSSKLNSKHLLQLVH